MKATEDNVFPVCDRFFSDNGRAPTGDELIKLCGGGKKEMLALRDKWKALHYLKEHGLNVPTRWISLLSDFFKEAEDDISALRASMIEEINRKVEAVQQKLDEEREKRTAAERSAEILQQKIEIEKQTNSDLQKSIDALQQQVRSLEGIREKQSAEISEKSLQARLLMDQISDLKQEHARALEQQQQRLEKVIEDQKSELKEAATRYDDVRNHNEDLRGKLMVAESEYARIKKELATVTADHKQEKVNSQKLAASLDAVKKKLADESTQVARIPKLEEQIKRLEQKVNDAESASSKALQDQVSELAKSLKSLSERVIPEEKVNEQKPGSNKGPTETSG
jgi:chromosome segregation ATPase